MFDICDYEHPLGHLFEFELFGFLSSLPGIIINCLKDLNMDEDVLG
jgi:hypothetical protein